MITGRLLNLPWGHMSDLINQLFLTLTPGYILHSRSVRLQLDSLMSPGALENVIKGAEPDVQRKEGPGLIVCAFNDALILKGCLQMTAYFKISSVTN